MMAFILGLILWAKNPIGKVVAVQVSLSDQGQLRTFYVIQTSEPLKPEKSLIIKRRLPIMSEILDKTETLFWQPIALVKILWVNETLALAQLEKSLLSDSQAFTINRPLQGDGAFWP